MTIKAPEPPHGHLEVASFDPYRLAGEQCVRQLPPRRRQYPAKRRTGDAHAVGTLLLLQPFQVFEAYCLRLVNSEGDLLKNPLRNVGGPEVAHLGHEGDSAPILRSTHDFLSLSSERAGYEHMLIMTITIVRFPSEVKGVYSFTTYEADEGPGPFPGGSCG
jgi:hypothetical protein